MTRAPAPEAPPAPPAAAPPLALVAELAGRLEAAGVAYCHWKSTVAIDRSAAGENDLDLLVRRGDAGAFAEVLARLGFVRAARRRSAVPGIESFYGLDAGSGGLVHVHAHYALVLGDDRTKNYRLPIEDAYIRSAAPSGVLRIPAPELELAVLVIRLVLKYCTWDELVWRRLRGGRAAPKRSEREELRDLCARADPEAAGAALRRHVPQLGAALFGECLAAVTQGAGLGRRLAAGRRLERALQPHARRSRRADRALRIGRRVTLTLRLRVRGDERNRPATGGLMVAVIGGDGAGKSTALEALRRWLAGDFEVRLVHLGKPRWSATTVVVRAGLKAVRLVPVRRLSRAVDRYRPPAWLLCTARDRERAYRRARRAAMRGELVLCDRYPHPRLTSMDVPRVAGTLGGRPPRRLERTVIRLEEDYHRRIAPPDLLVVLLVDPEIAVARKTGEDPASVRRRGAEVWNVDWRRAGAHVVDAGRPPEDVARELKALVWSALGGSR